MVLFLNQFKSQVCHDKTLVVSVIIYLEQPVSKFTFVGCCQGISHWCLSPLPNSEGCIASQEGFRQKNDSFNTDPLSFLLSPEAGGTLCPFLGFSILPASKNRSDHLEPGFSAKPSAFIVGFLHLVRKKELNETADYEDGHLGRLVQGDAGGQQLPSEDHPSSFWRGI